MNVEADELPYLGGMLEHVQLVIHELQAGQTKLRFVIRHFRIECRHQQKQQHDSESG